MLKREQADDGGVKTHLSSTPHLPTTRLMRSLGRVLKDRTTTASERAEDARHDRVLVEQGQFVRSIRS